MRIENIIDLRKSIMKLYVTALDDSKNGVKPSFQNDVTELFDDIIIREFKEKFGVSSSNGVSHVFPPTYRRIDEMSEIKNPLK